MHLENGNQNGNNKQYCEMRIEGPPRDGEI
jgi:hypothetical protein